MLSKNGRQIAHRVHALVAAAFIGPYPEGKVINHIDHRRTNNAASNLEYVTQAENLQKARDAGRYLVRRSMGTPRPPEWFWRLFQPGA
jgi:hypothetical protein